MVAIIVFWQTVKRRADSRGRFAGIVGVLFVISVGLSIYEASQPVDAVVAVGGASLSYQVMKALLENIGLFAIITLLLALLTRRLKSARREAEILAQVAANSADAIVAVDMSGTITSWNLGAEMLFGYYADEIRGSRITRILQDAYAAEFEAVVAKCLRESFVRGVSAGMLARGNMAMSADVTLSTFTDDMGTVMGMSLFIRDVTERKKLEEELLQSSKMAAMGTMAAGIVHEFGNLLTVISGRTQLGKTAKTLEEANTAFDAVSACAARAKSVTSNLLAYAKRQKPHRTMGSVANSAEAALVLLDKELKRANIEIVRDYGDVPETAFDHEQITQVFMNLIINAMNAMRDGGKVEIAISTRNTYIEARVRDSGPGIPDAVMARLFEPFSTVGGEVDGKPRTGLGLFVCREIVKFHAGSISVERGGETGTIFRIYLPIATIGDGAKSSDTKLFDRAECRVAVIDRDSMIRDLLAEALRRRGMKALSFQDAPAALAGDAGKEFDLVFVDASLKDASGNRLVDALKREAGPCVVAMVGEAMDAEELHRLEEGTLRMLRKPFGIDQINSVCDMLTIAGDKNSPAES
jgi:PAS domain S-box-containing protein